MPLPTPPHITLFGNRCNLPTGNSSSPFYFPALSLLPFPPHGSGPVRDRASRLTIEEHDLLTGRPAGGRADRALARDEVAAHPIGRLARHIQGHAFHGFERTNADSGSASFESASSDTSPAERRVYGLAGMSAGDRLRYGAAECREVEGIWRAVAGEAVAGEEVEGGGGGVLPLSGRRRLEKGEWLRFKRVVLSVLLAAVSAQEGASLPPPSTPPPPPLLPPSLPPLSPSSLAAEYSSDAGPAKSVTRLRFHLLLFSLADLWSPLFGAQEARPEGERTEGDGGREGGEGERCRALFGAVREACEAKERLTETRQRETAAFDGTAAFGETAAFDAASSHRPAGAGSQSWSPSRSPSRSRSAVACFPASRPLTGSRPSSVRLGSVPLGSVRLGARAGARAGSADPRGSTGAPLAVPSPPVASFSSRPSSGSSRPSSGSPVTARLASTRLARAAEWKGVAGYKKERAEMERESERIVVVEARGLRGLKVGRREGKERKVVCWF